jgi:TfoX/Sxy family transcriptional regulator of competence genes
MATSKKTIEFMLDALALVPGVTVRPMMGEYCVYSAGRVFGLICNDTLFLKTTPETVQLFNDKTTRAYAGSKNTCQANADWLENRVKMAEIVGETLKNLPPAKPKRTKKK